MEAHRAVERAGPRVMPLLIAAESENPGEGAGAQERLWKGFECKGLQSYGSSPAMSKELNYLTSFGSEQKESITEQYCKQISAVQT